MEANDFKAQEIESVELNTFDVAYNIIGGGEEGGKKNIGTKEEADHSLPYMMAVLLLDGNVLPAQYAPGRILARDVQQLLQKVQVREKQAYSDRFPGEMACDITVVLNNGRELYREKQDYEGFYTRPASWETIEHKFSNLVAPYLSESVRSRIINVVKGLENYPVAVLMDLLAGTGS
jgi:2-methylcitrate dehydratase